MEDETATPPVLHAVALTEGALESAETASRVAILTAIGEIAAALEEEKELAIFAPEPDESFVDIAGAEAAFRQELAAPRTAALANDCMAAGSRGV